MTDKPHLQILLCSPRGFCAGVDRAIQMVEVALERYGAPVYVRHQIVHNRFVVESLERRGAVFVKDLDEIPETGQPVIFSAHGVPKSVPERAESLNLFALDATCPLVTKVHKQVRLHHSRGLHVLMIGHAGHPEVVGTMGQLPSGAVTLIETVEDARTVAPQDAARLAFVTQTTLSVDDTAEIVEVLKARFPDIVGPLREDICYATTNRQEAVKAVAPRADAMIVVGAPNSSNSRRLVEVAQRAGCAKAHLVQRAGDIDWTSLEGAGTIGITAGASAPEVLVEEVIAALADHFDIDVKLVSTANEDVTFHLPRALRDAAE
ncbi:MAG: 4-hydroxy-3-methylbut-2-enyl diphosphate reductase [Rhodobiaceae bacterium]|nr:4-hydroxy-3-methylbut-2-enyl diphosphate reductase [Rhodobiaceae bacterium]